jgi:CBS domain-containing protein
MKTLQKLTVKDAYQLVDEDPILVRMTDEFNQIINNFAHHTDLRGIFVVDDENRFSGLITRTDLLDWARAKLGGYFQEPLTTVDKTIRLVSLINAFTAGDVLRTDTKNAAVFANDTLAHALRIMIESDLTFLPVIDESHHIIGSLTLSELLNLATT